MTKNKKMILQGRELLCDALGTTPPTPDYMISSMSSVEFPWEGEVLPSPKDGEPTHNLLYDEYRIQVPVISWPVHSTKYIRISAHIYNTKEEYEYLSESLKSIVGS